MTDEEIAAVAKALRDAQAWGAFERLAGAAIEALDEHRKAARTDKDAEDAARGALNMAERAGHFVSDP